MATARVEARLAESGHVRCDHLMYEGMDEPARPPVLDFNEQACRDRRFECQHQFLAVQTRGLLDDDQVRFASDDGDDGEHRPGFDRQSSDSPIEHTTKIIGNRCGTDIVGREPAAVGGRTQQSRRVG